MSRRGAFVDIVALLKMGSILALFLLLFIPIGCLAQGCQVANERVEIKENNPVGYVVTTIVIDPDYIMTVFDNTEWFEIKGTELLLKKSLDYEVETTLDVSLHCIRNGITEKTTRVYVTVLNLNDNAPTFKQSAYNFTVPEDAKVGTSIGHEITADDLDMDTIFYKLSGPIQAATDHFRLSSVNNPIILVNQSLDYDNYNYTQLILTARDTQGEGVNGSHTATATINIEISDVDNKPPLFLPCRKVGVICINDGYTTNVTRSEKVTGALDLKPAPLYAIDGDTGINAPIEYSLVTENTGGIFAVDSASGNITMTRAADNLGIILLQIMAAQADDLLKYATTTVQIEVVEKNNHPPTFEKKNYLGTIPAHSAIGTLVTDSSSPNRPLQVFAADGDFTDRINPFLTYAINGTTDFTVSRDGYIKNNALFSSPATIRFSVLAEDTTTGEKDSTDVVVEITPSVAPTTVTTTTTLGPGTTTTSGTGPTTTKSPGTGTTATTTPGTGTTTTTTSGTGPTTTKYPGTGTTATTTPGTGTTTTTTSGTGPTTTKYPGTGTTATTTPGTGTTTTTTSGTGPTTTKSPGTGPTTTTTPGTGTTTTTTSGTGPTTTKSPGTGPTTTTTPGTGTTTTTSPVQGTTTTATPGTGTTTSTTHGTGTTTSTIPGTGTTATTSPGTGTTTSTTPGTGTTISPGTGTSTTTSPGADTTTTTLPGIGTTTTTSPGIGTTKNTTPGTGTATTRSPGTEGDKVPGGGYSATDMAALGATLGVILALCLAGLGFLIHKHYGDQIRNRMSKSSGDNFGGSEDRTEQLIDDDDDADDPNSGSAEVMPTSISYGVENTVSKDPFVPDLVLGASTANVFANAEPSNVPHAEKPEEGSDPDDKKEVKSILTKEFKEDPGYKSVWFREDATPEVVVIQGVEEGEADDGETEEGYNQDDDDDDEDQLSPNFLGMNNDNNYSDNFSQL
ncbi:cadherin related family member 5 S homeolog isoform X1 [Xenopus laevis]|uniref:Cadherin related family member 5 S homeolog isoform X1 n=1 Tax=Xenopus laevis TaxID=8355 RepID=A0A8J1MZH1_XENLA|nr:cadherin related family member 5 S homeolog isoform X1 [Xenopus laevis]